MPNTPFEHKNLPPFLTNFSFENKHDQLVYDYVTQGRQFDVKFIQNIQKVVADAEKDPSCSEHETRLLKYWREAEIRAIEMERLAMALDLKICQLADHVLEPFPGMFQQVGVSRVYKAHTMWRENPDALRADQKAKLKVIKGGKE